MYKSQLDAEFVARIRGQIQIVLALQSRRYESPAQVVMFSAEMAGTKFRGREGNEQSRLQIAFSHLSLLHVPAAGNVHAAMRVHH